MQIIDESELLEICQNIDLENMFHYPPNSYNYRETEYKSGNYYEHFQPLIPEYLSKCPVVSMEFVELPQLVHQTHIYIHRKI